MNNEQVERIIREYISQVVHMSLGTCVDNKPWVCEVHFSYDDELNVYFRSDPDRRHSREIEINPNVAGNIITQHFKNQKVRGVYFEGTAERLTEVDEHHPAYKVVFARYGKANIHAGQNPEGPSYYKISVKNWYLFDTYGPEAPQKYQLSWKA